MQAFGNNKFLIVLLQLTIMGIFALGVIAQDPDAIAVVNWVIPTLSIIGLMTSCAILFVIYHLKRVFYRIPDKLRFPKSFIIWTTVHYFFIVNVALYGFLSKDTWHWTLALVAFMITGIISISFMKKFNYLYDKATK